MSRLETALEVIVTELVLAGGRASHIGCRDSDGRYYRVECARVDSEAEAKITRQSLERRIKELEKAADPQGWEETYEIVKAGLRQIYQALGGKGDPKNAKEIVELAEKQVELKRRASNSSAQLTELNYQVYKALRALHEKLGAPTPAAEVGSLALIQEIDEHVQDRFRELSEAIAEVQS